jgi:hypothetical protein
MKKIVFLLCFVYCFSCVAQVSRGSDSTAYYRQKLAKANDSIKVLNQRTVMSSSDFLRIYKYERLLKYYKICKRKPTQWKYYKGWSTRVFEQ